MGPMSAYTKTAYIGKGSGAFVVANNSYLSLAASSDWAVGTGDFTVELWVNATTTGNENFLVSLGTAANIGLAIGNAGKNFNCYLNGVKVLNQSINSFATNSWFSFALSRSGGVLYQFMGGTLLNVGGTADTTNVTDNASTLYIGCNDPAGNTNDNFPGSMTNIRFTNGTGLYTADYTPATSPLTAGANTKLLLRFESSPNLLIDKSGTNKTVTNNAVTWSSATPF